MSEDKQILTAAQYLKFDEYDLSEDQKDPGKEDILFLVKVAKLIPKTPEKLNDVDPGLIATYCLAAIQTANVKYAKALMWQRMKKVSLDSVLGRKMAESSEPATVKEKMAKASPEYEEAARLYGLSEAYVDFYKNMLENFRATHYWAREQESASRLEERASSYDPHTGGNVKGRKTLTSEDVSFDS
jgi:hypothetical protein